MQQKRKEYISDLEESEAGVNQFRQKKMSSERKLLVTKGKVKEIQW